MLRKPLTALAVAGAALSVLAATADAGYSTMEQCTSLSGTVTYSPGLVKNPKAVHAVITGTISGCSGLNGPQAGTGTFTATLSGNASASANNQAGTFVINWPAASGLNPTVGTVNLAGPNNNVLTLNGSDKGGAFASGVMSTSLFVTAQQGAGTRAHPIAQQSFVNTLPLQIRVNPG
jgi:hypothetical protein